MKRTTWALYHFMRADFLERIRRDSFLLTLGLTVYACYMFVPPEDANYVALYLGNRRGLYNSAWIGILFGWAAGIFLTLFGFYLVKNAIDRDRQTGVGQIVAATPTSKLIYAVGKWLSNLAVLGLILGVLTVMALIMQLIRAEDVTIHLGALVTPIWSMGLPVLAVIAAVAVLFESIPFLRSGFGNVAYFFLWVGMLMVMMGPAFMGGSVSPEGDILGMRWAMADISQQLLAENPDVEFEGDFLGPKSVLNEENPIFVWDGIRWAAPIFLERLIWMSGAAVIALGAAIPFDRFDPARTRLKRKRRGLFPRLRGWIGSIMRGEFLWRRSGETGSPPITTSAHLTPLTGTASRKRFFGMLVAELRLMLRRQGWLWYGGVIGLTIACVASPPGVVAIHLIPAAWLWPVLVWSQMGAREAKHNTGQMVFSTPRPATRQLPAMWLAGVIVTGITTSGAMLFLALNGEMSNLLAWGAGVLFVPTLALALGVWSGTSRLFEVVYPLLWYIGLISQIPVFDYAGTTAEGLAMGIPVVYLGITVVLVVLAVIWRRQQLKG